MKSCYRCSQYAVCKYKEKFYPLVREMVRIISARSDDINEMACSLIARECRYYTEAATSEKEKRKSVS